MYRKRRLGRVYYKTSASEMLIVVAEAGPMRKQAIVALAVAEVWL